MATKSWKKLKRSSKKSFSSAFPGQLTDCLVEADCQVRSTSRFYRGARRWPARLLPRWPAYMATRPIRADLGTPCFGHRTIQSLFFSLWALFSLKYLYSMYVCMYLCMYVCISIYSKKDELIDQGGCARPCVAWRCPQALVCPNSQWHEWIPWIKK